MAWYYNPFPTLPNALPPYPYNPADQENPLPLILVPYAAI